MTELNLNGITDLPKGKLATVVTVLEMTAPPAGARKAANPAGLSLHAVATPDPARYRALYRAIGEDWLWFSRIRMRDTDLAAILADPAVDVYIATVGGEEVGLVELDRRTPGEIELAFFGLVAGFVGRGAGHWLMDRALELAWAHTPRRLWVHTCTLDHPNALSFYIRAGFTPTARQLEIVDDPRLDGTLPEGAARHVPLIRP
ncbi:MAG: GNAT family N-acetyltransferase [Hyphomicrobiales bacterium]|nr:GNAT family N-acetyltransferase [Hyphomicrobiales bacterium]